MKWLFAYTCLLVMPSVAFTQQLTPEFEMQLFFEDAVGNRDTLEMGYDRLGGYDFVHDDTIMDPRFGEVVIVEPFDSTFEVRAFHSDDYFTWRDSVQMSKRIIGGSEGGPPDCSVAKVGGIAINAKYLPVTISYDPSPFIEDYCHIEAVLLSREVSYVLEEWWDPESEPFYCLSNGVPIVLDFAYYFDSEELGSFEYNIPVEGGTRKKIPLLMFEIFGAGWGPCPTTVAVDDVLPDPISVYPNPTNGRLYVDIKNIQSARDIRIFNASGILIEHHKRLDDFVDVSSLSAGVYLLLIEINGQSTVEKFVKL